MQMDAPADTNNGWSKKIEALANSYLVRAIDRKSMHKDAYTYYKKKHKLFKWIGATIMALAGISGVSMPNGVSELSTTIVFIVVILFGFAVQWYGENEEYNETAQQNLAYSDNYESIVDDIREQLAFERKDRAEGQKYITNLKLSFTKYKDLGPSIPTHIEQKANKKQTEQVADGKIEVVVDRASTTSRESLQKEIEKKLRDKGFDRDMKRLQMGINYEMHRFKSTGNVDSTQETKSSP